ncbi:hypothetical protein SCHPADRAFT_993424 [Schizopora paradoxa]|uniref:Sfi1 spindle body domain-containing protein n=1 Tax=Schizopora paradoxa TaxID=27342 RepID=A0A0H2SA09_9AGAM|nr:hypothetical protein SCHPADRAFT_993424 [Schizopora paradoxa]
MAFFQPTRTSPKVPSRTLPLAGRGAAATATDSMSMMNALDSTISSTTSNAIAALSGLSSRDVRIVDEIIRRVPSATTFPTMFKAYNAVLQEHGLDATNDVVYYKILLKVGVVKGPNWGSRWETAKAQLGYDELVDQSEVGGEAETEAEEETPVKAKPTTTHTARLSRFNASPERHVPQTRHMFIDPEDESAASEKDSFTVHSHREDDENTQTEDDATEDGATEDSPTTLVQPAPIRATGGGRNALHLQTGPSTYPPLPSITEFLPVQAKKVQYGRQGANVPTAEKPHSHRHEETRLPAATSRLVRRGSPVKNDDSQRTVQVAKPADNSKPSHPTHDEDTWKKIKIQRDEKEADRFREIILLERYFRLWVDGLRWIKSTDAEVSKNRDKYLCSIALDKWRSRAAAKHQFFDQATKQLELYLLLTFYKKWRKRLKTKKMMVWRDDMRKRMAQVRQMVDDNLKERFWSEWRRAYQIRLSDNLYEQQLQRRFLARWKESRMLLQDREHDALELEQNFQHRQLADLLDYWRSKIALYRKEKQVINLVTMRIVSSAWTKWRDSLNEVHELQTRHDHNLKNIFFVQWRKRLQKSRSLNEKADKYKARQDAVLVRAVMRVWLTKERGLLLERATSVRRIQDAWQIWRTRIKDLNVLQNKALEFAGQTNLIVQHSAMSHWRQTLLNRHKLSSLAQQYYDEHLQSRMLTFWRIRLRQYIRTIKQARIARRYLVMRKSWDKWVENMRVKIIQKKAMRKYFDMWRAATARAQYHRFAQKKVEALINQRLKQEALQKWTEHVVFLKLRELETNEKRDLDIVRKYLGRWQSAHKECTDLIGLMQSHLYVKNEELLRRAFHSWLVLAKAKRERRLILAEREEEARLIRLATAWDTWREKLQALRLKPLEKAFRIQQDKNTLYRAFMIWNQRTMSTPAIRFYNTRLKAKYWRVWRDVMPMALQAKKARKFDRKKLLSRVIDKWVQAHRTKIALKAVARARYLRLPSGAPRKPLPYSSVLSGALQSSRSAPSAPSLTSGKSTRPDSPGEDDKDRQEVRSESNFGETRLGVRSRLLPPLGGRPVRSQGGGSEDGKTDLWLALRRRHGRAGPSTARSDTMDDRV